MLTLFFITPLYSGLTKEKLYFLNSFPNNGIKND